MKLKEWYSFFLKASIEKLVNHQFMFVKIVIESDLSEIK